MCGEWFETVKHIVSGCGQLAKKQYMIRHDKMGIRIHWELCRKYGIDCSSKWYNHVPCTLGTPDNLFRMGKSVASKCHLCNGTGCGILHILSACNQALALGRYKYRHDNILSVIVSAISNFLISPRPICFFFVGGILPFILWILNSKFAPNYDSDINIIQWSPCRYLSTQVMVNL